MFPLSPSMVEAKERERKQNNKKEEAEQQIKRDEPRKRERTSRGERLIICYLLPLLALTCVRERLTARFRVLVAITV